MNPLMASSCADTMSMLRDAESTFDTSVEYSSLARLLGTAMPVAFHNGLLMTPFSPRSVKATMLRVFEVVPVLLVIHTSMRLILMPVVRLGSDCMAWSYCWRKKCERKKWRFSS